LHFVLKTLSELVSLLLKDLSRLEKPLVHLASLRMLVPHLLNRCIRLHLHCLKCSSFGLERLILLHNLLVELSHHFFQLFLYGLLVGDQSFPLENERFLPLISQLNFLFKVGASLLKVPVCHHDCVGHGLFKAFVEIDLLFAHHDDLFFLRLQIRPSLGQLFRQFLDF